MSKHSIRLMSTTALQHEVLFETLGNAGIITLNKPKVLNILNTSMVKNMQTQLRKWESQRSLIMIKGTGNKAFCAGGDLKGAIEKRKGPEYVQKLYDTICFIANYKIPYIGIIHGYTLGGGLALSVLGRYRIATEKTQIALPSAKTGFFPSDGGTYFLPRFRDNLGFYLGLTGDWLKGKDVVHAGIATHLVSSQRLDELQRLLSHCSNDREVNALLTKFHEALDDFSLASNINHIDYCFSGTTIETIIERLKNVHNEWSKKTLQTLYAMCPGSLKISLRALQRGAHLNLAQCLQMEYRIYCRLIEGYDFPEGVRALLIDKDNSPKWKHASLSEVDDDYVESFFKKLPQDKELQLFDAKL